MSRPTDRAPVSARRAWIARETSSRGASSSTKRSPADVVQGGALAADRLGYEEALAPGHADDGGGVELEHLEVGEAAPAACASSRPVPCDPGGLVVRAHSAAAPPVASTTARARTVSRALADQAAAALLSTP